MHVQFSVIGLLVFTEIIFASSAQHPDEHKSRVVDQDISSKDHIIDGIHNPEYDQESLFGRDAKHLSELSPEEKSEKLSSLFDKMDANNDGYVPVEELRAWMNKMHENTIKEDAKRAWKEMNLTSSALLTFEEYATFMKSDEGYYKQESPEEQVTSLKRDKRRFDAADVNKDGKLSLDEAAAFYDPQSHPAMHHIFTLESIEEMDKNKDGFIDLEEYISDFWHPLQPDEEEPEWVASEKQIFLEKRDTNHDGKLDEAEVKNWLFPPDMDYMESEVKHLLSECDSDKDGRLSKEEVMNRYDLLMESPVTNYGEGIEAHDEL